MRIVPSLVKELREKTGVGIMDCKEALIESAGDLNNAIEILRRKGKVKAIKRSGRKTSEGAIISYIHLNSKIGVILELNCETDFVARTEEFKNLGKELAMQIAASSPLYISKEDVPEDVILKEKRRYIEELKREGRPEGLLEKIADGRIKRYLEEVCLFEQPYIRDEKRKVHELILEAIAKIGENITVRRFTRYEVGGG